MNSILERRKNIKDSGFDLHFIIHEALSQYDQHMYAPLFR
jgi:hypothetical protein